MKCDIVFLAHGRPEFTAASAAALEANTNWDRVTRLLVYTDGGPLHGDHPLVRLWAGNPSQDPIVIETRKFGGPVNIMNHYLSGKQMGAHDFRPAPVWAKIDNDVIVPPGWLDAGMDVMQHNPELSFLGLEPPASRTRSPYGGKLPPAPEANANNWTIAPVFMKSGMICWACYVPCDAIGGVGFMRTSAWDGRPPMVQHSTYGGFTDWQQRNSDLVKGWIVPPIKLFLLDRLPIEPWASLSKKYEAAGMQRFWTRYPMEAAPALWDWWGK